MKIYKYLSLHDYRQILSIRYYDLNFEYPFVYIYKNKYKVMFNLD